jgi:hypothetical protein
VIHQSALSLKQKKTQARAVQSLTRGAQSGQSTNASTFPHQHAFQTRQQPQFGGFGLSAQAVVPAIVDRLVPTFQTITEVFLAAFLAQDVISMWVPRIRQSLVRGAVPYDPKSDPENKNLTPWQLTKRYMSKTVQGLNWVNFSEETKREFATGPGVLIIPALFFAMARRWFGKTSVEMGHKPLTQLTGSFMTHLENSGINKTADLSEAAFKAEMVKFIKSRFGMDQKTLQDVVIGQKPLTQHLDEWTHQWVENAMKTNASESAVKKAAQAELETLNSKLYQLIMTDLNKGVRTADFIEKASQMEVRLADGLKKAGQATHEHVHNMPITEFTSHLTRWKDFALEVFNTKTAKYAGKAVPLSDLTKNLYEKLVTRKGLYAIGVTLAAGFYLIRLAKWAQSHETYEANRLLQEPVAGQPAQQKSGQQNQPAKPEQAVAFKPAASSQELNLDALLRSLQQPEQPTYPQTSKHGDHKPAPTAQDWTRFLPASPVVTQLPTTPVYAANAFNPNPVYSNPTYNNVPQGFSYGVVNYPAPSYQQNPVTGFYPASAGTGNWGMAPGPFSYGSRAAS